MMDPNAAKPKPSIHCNFALFSRYVLMYFLKISLLLLNIDPRNFALFSKLESFGKGIVSFALDITLFFSGGMNSSVG